MSVVVIAHTTQDLKPALDAIFAPHGGLEAVIPPKNKEGNGTVYLKPNAVHFAPHTYTDPAVLEALLAYLRDHAYTRLAVMESCTGGNFTRLVFKVTGYTDICQRYGAEPVYLDEGPTVEVDLCDGTRVRVSLHLHDNVIQRLDDQHALPGPPDGYNTGAGGAAEPATIRLHALAGKIARPDGAGAAAVGINC